MLTVLCVTASLVIFEKNPLHCESPAMIRMSLDSATCRVGDTVVITEVVPQWGWDVRTISHIVVRVGRYDKNSGQLSNLKASDFVEQDADDSFTGLPHSMSASHGSLLRAVGGGRGTSFDAIPQAPGIYLISCRWKPEGKAVAVACVPVLLTVFPQTNGLGKPILKPEWFEDE